ncbi:MAG: hypothetical protein WB797_15050, partial [Nocardioides sp.]
APPGAVSAPAWVAEAGAPPAGEPPGRRRRVGLVALAAVCVLALVAGGVVAGLAYAGRHHNDRATATTSTLPVTPAGTDASTGTNTGTSTGPSTGSSTGSTAPATKKFVCWDTSITTSLAACGSPYDAAHTSTSRAGLNWVFFDRGPRLENAGAVCRDISLAGNRVLHRQCTFHLGGGQPVCMDWSQFRSVDGALADYGRLGSPSYTRQPGMTVAFYGPAYIGSSGCGGLPYKGAKMVRGQRWGVTAYAHSRTAVRSALSHYGQFRLKAQWDGVPR